MAPIGTASDLGTFNQITSTSQRLSEKVNQLNIQSSTGQKAQLYSDFASDARLYTGTFDLKSENTQLIDDYNICAGRLQNSEVKLRAINQRFDEFRIQLTQVLSPDASKSTNFTQFCSQALQSIQSALNGKDLQGDNLFGGNKTSGIACDITQLPTFTLGQGPSYAYAVGDDTLQQVGPSTTYGITAFEQGIAQVLQCLKIGADNPPNGDPNSTSMQLLRQCMGTANDAASNLSQTLGKVLLDQSQINDQVKELEDNNAFLDENLSKIMDVDPLRAHVEAARIDTEMTIARQALKQMMKSSMDLLDILR